MVENAWVDQWIQNFNDWTALLLHFGFFALFGIIIVGGLTFGSYFAFKMLRIELKKAIERVSKD